MIVSEKNISDALHYLATDPHPIAEARFNLTKAENRTRETFASHFLKSNEKTNDAKRAGVECHMEYVAAKNAEADAVLEYERHKSRVKAAEMLLEIWRTENANARAAERVR